MLVAAIIQARMGSTRLPGKTLMSFGGATVLEHVVARVRLARRIQRVVVATTERADDNAIVGECERLGVDVVRGSEPDVLARYVVAARSIGADVVVRITADCPLLDPAVTDRVVDALAESPAADYASNGLVASFPHGLDAEALPAAILEVTAREAREPAEREHVTPFIYNRPERFRLRNVRAEQDYSRLRWTLDTPADLENLRRIAERAGIRADRIPPFASVARLIEGDPLLMALNAKALQSAASSGLA